MSSLAGVVLAAGQGTRLRPLTNSIPKALCPINNRAMLDHAIDRVAPHVSDLAVNAHHFADQIEQHVAGRAIKVSVESPEALGTAGALGALRDWVRGRPVLIYNADAWIPESLGALVDGWDGHLPRLLVKRQIGPSDFGPWRFVGASLLPGVIAASLPPQPLGLYEAVWREAFRRGQLELVSTSSDAIDCGTLNGYLRANLAANGGQSVIGRTASVQGEVVRSVVWDGCTVRRGERLVDSVRARQDLTLQASGPEQSE